MKVLLKGIFFVLLIVSSLSADDMAHVERRAAVDVGSGSTKVTIADVDTMNKKIVSVVFEDSFPVPYQASLESSYDGSFDQATCSLGLKTFLQIKEIAEDLKVQKVSVVATAAFREANNGERFAQQVYADTGFDLKIIPQKEEGVLAFFSGIASSDENPEDLIVWDIGTGSFQITTMNEGGELAVYMGSVASIPFRNYIIDIIQGKNSDEVSTPNPMTEEDIKAADKFARALGRKALPVIKDKVKQTETTLLGIGRLFSNSVGPLSKDSVLVRKDLRNYISQSTGLSDIEMNNPYAHVDVSNAILVLAVMKALHIQEIQIVDTKSTRGMLIYEPYWK